MITNKKIINEKAISNKPINSQPKFKKMGWIVITGLFILIVAGFGFKNSKYWPTPNSAQLTQQLNGDLDGGLSANINEPIDKVKVYKSKRYLELISNDRVIQRYPIRLGFDPLGTKRREGDGKTPEGTYTLDWRNPNSQFYKSLHVSYPNAQDKQQAAAQGLSAGSNIMIHGSFPTRGKTLKELKPLHHYLPQEDWTLGCIAVTNAAMDDIWSRVKNGTLIEIVP